MSSQLDRVKKDLAEYGWGFDVEKNKDESETVLTDFVTSQDFPIDILINFSNGVFYVNTVNFLEKIPTSYSVQFLKFTFPTFFGKFFCHDLKGDKMNVDFGFEIPEGFYSQKFFFAFLDQLTESLDAVVDVLIESEILKKP